MNRILSLTFALFAAIAANAQAIYQPGQHDNLITVVAADAADNLKEYPIELLLTNPTVSMCGIEAYFYIDDNSIRPWVYDEDEEEYAYERNSSRTYKSLKYKLMICDEDNPKHPGHFYVNFVDDRDFKLTEGAIATIYLDATKLSTGDHVLHVVEPMCSYVSDDLSSASYFCSNQDIHFNISGGTLTVLNGIHILSPLDANAATYDLLGRKVNATSHGIYLQNGRKVIR